MYKPYHKALNYLEELLQEKEEDEKRSEIEALHREEHKETVRRRALVLESPRTLSSSFFRVCVCVCVCVCVFASHSLLSPKSSFNHDTPGPFPVTSSQNRRCSSYLSSSATPLPAPSCRLSHLLRSLSLDS